MESGSAPAEEKREDDLWLLDFAADTAKVKKEEPALVKEEPVTDDEEQEEEEVAAEALDPPPPNFRYRCTKCDNMEVFSTRADFDTHALMRHESQVLSKKNLAIWERTKVSISTVLIFRRKWRRSLSAHWIRRTIDARCSCAT